VVPRVDVVVEGGLTEEGEDNDVENDDDDDDTEGIYVEVEEDEGKDTREAGTPMIWSILRNIGAITSKAIQGLTVDHR
jgi:hypothetical protein